MEVQACENEGISGCVKIFNIYDKSYKKVKNKGVVFFT